VSPCDQFRELLYKEVFFLVHHMHMTWSDVWTMYPFERRWFIHNFIDQKERENEAYEKAKKKR
jgi:hypothetical protein